MRKKLLPVIMLLFFFTQLWAQTGKLVGVISDKKSGEPLVGVNVLIEGTVLGASTDGDGYYVIVGLQAGTYNVNVSYIGYQPVAVQEVLIKSGLTTTINAEMGEDQLQLEETIVVIAERPIIQRDLTSSKAITTETEIELLPVDNVTDIVNLTPGFVDGHARGGRDGEIVYKIDGVDAQDPATGGYDTEVPDFALQEVSVETGGYGAEFGNAQSGVVSMTMAEGGADYSGRFRITTSDFGKVNSDWSDHHREKLYEFSVGGPELLSHLFTGQRDKLRLRISGTFQKDYGRMEHFMSHDNSIMGKLMYRVNDNNKITITGQYKDGESGFWGAQWKKHVLEDEDTDINGNGIRDTYSMLNGLPLDFDDSDMFAINWMKTLSKDSYFEVQIDRYRTKRKYDVDETAYGTPGAINYTDNNRNMILDHTENLPEDQQMTWGDVDVNNSQDSDGYYTPGTGETFYRLRWNLDEKEIYHAKAYYFDQLNKNHQLKAGIGGKLYDIYDFDIDLASGGNMYNTDYEATPYWFEVFAEDKMEYGDFIMRLGLRFDYFYADGVTPGDPMDPIHVETGEIKDPQKVSAKKVISPRIGISHPISSNDVIYFNYGKYTQIPIMSRLFDNANYGWDGAFPIMGNTDIGFEETVGYEIGLKHSFNMTTKIEIKGFFKDITGLAATKKYLLGPGYQYNKFLNEDYGTVRGVELTLRRVNGRYIDGMINYSYMFAMGKSSSAFANYNYGNDNAVIPNKESPLDWDQRHTLTTTINARIPNDRNLFGTSVFNNLMASIIFNYGSGVPYSPTSKSRKPLINTERFPYTSRTDIRVQKVLTFGRYDAKLFVRSENLFDKKDIIDPIQADIDFYHNDLDGDGKRDKRAEGKYGNIRAYDEGRRVWAGIQFGF